MKTRAAQSDGTTVSQPAKLRPPTLAASLRAAGVDRYLKQLPPIILRANAFRLVSGPFQRPRQYVYSKSIQLPAWEEKTAVKVTEVNPSMYVMRAAVVDVRHIQMIHMVSSAGVAEKVAAMKIRLAAWKARYPRTWEQHGMRIMEALQLGDKAGKSTRIHVGRCVNGEGPLYLLNGHHRFAALAMLAAQGAIPLHWLRSIPVRWVDMIEGWRPNAAGIALDTGEVLAAVSRRGVTPARAYYTLRALAGEPASPFIEPFDVRRLVKEPFRELKDALQLLRSGQLCGSDDPFRSIIYDHAMEHGAWMLFIHCWDAVQDAEWLTLLHSKPWAKSLLLQCLFGLHCSPPRELYEPYVLDVRALLRHKLADPAQVTAEDLLQISAIIGSLPDAKPPLSLQQIITFYCRPFNDESYRVMVRENPLRLTHAHHVWLSVATYLDRQNDENASVVIYLLDGAGAQSHFDNDSSPAWGASTFWAAAAERIAADTRTPCQMKIKSFCMDMATLLAKRESV